MSKSWEHYKSAPIEVFHGEALKEFHQGAEFKTNETFENGMRFINGIEFNRLVAQFKMKIIKHYDILRDAVLFSESEK